MSYEIKVPALGESIVEATVARWLKRAGEAVAAGEAVVELETDKVNLEVASDQAGVIAAITKGEGDVVAVGDVLGSVSSGDAAVVAAPVAAPVATPAAAPVAAPTPTPDPRLPTPVTPVAHRVAAEHALDLSGVPGSGPGGRVTKEDVLKAVAAPTPAPAPAPPPSPSPSPDSRLPTPDSCPSPSPPRRAPAAQPAPAHHRPPPRRGPADRRHAHHLQ